MTEQELDIVSEAIWKTLGDKCGRSGCSRDEWRHEVSDPHDKTMSSIKAQVEITGRVEVIPDYDTTRGKVD